MHKTDLITGEEKKKKLQQTYTPVVVVGEIRKEIEVEKKVLTKVYQKKKRSIYAAKKRIREEKKIEKFAFIERKKLRLQRVEA